MVGIGPNDFPGWDVTFDHIPVDFCGIAGAVTGWHAKTSFVLRHIVSPRRLGKTAGEKSGNNVFIRGLIFTIGISME